MNLCAPIQDERGAAAPPVTGAAGSGSAEGVGGAAAAAQPAAGQPDEASVERGLGSGPAVPGFRGQGRDPKLGRRATASQAAPQVIQNKKHHLMLCGHLMIKYGFIFLLIGFE